jgi:L,D-peptidoglycan transpeptidase YkuD (ErfK/YbiS/YcfS/YnhG family)
MARPQPGSIRSFPFSTGRTGWPCLSRSPLAPNDGWVDEPADANYNRLVSLPYPASAEQMWREDELYDALVVIGYNIDPIVPGAGSAIFLHVATPVFTTTAGCIAVQKQVLLGLLPQLGPGSKITIRG